MKTNMKRFIGFSMMASVFIGLFIFESMLVGWLISVLTFLVGVALLSFITLAHNLINSK